eukprot:TRINITY_DN957_c0_g2_i1.p2 TRINITY_DN957_c0_g2~~TRINITY_DN957_c0_g2_i1.p2  ORF type:complete len:250 (+),score=81.14 TRINITY_DN957_c0_g2_i1:58-807(+)
MADSPRAEGGAPPSPYSALLAKSQDLGYVFEERLEAGKALRLAGNAELKEGRVDRAVAAYRAGLRQASFGEDQMMDFREDHIAAVTDEKVPLLLNLAQVLTTRADPPELDAAVSAAREAVELRRQDNPKAWYWLARALVDSGADVDEALSAATEAQRQAPTDRAVTQLMSRIKGQQQEERRKQRDLYKKLSKGLDLDAQPEKAQVGAQQLTEPTARARHGVSLYVVLAVAVAAMASAVHLLMRKESSAD